MFISTKRYEADMKSLEERLSQSLTDLEAEQTAKFEVAVKEAEERIRADAQASFEAALAADRSKRYDSVEPFVEIVSETFSDEGGVQLRLDWNAPFIQYLKKNGFTGPTDEAIVDNWLISLSRERIAEGGSEFK